MVAYINKVGGTRFWSLWRETESLFATAVHLGISIRARFIPGKMNVIADNLYRAGQILPTEWFLHQDMARHVFDTWGQNESRPIRDTIQQVPHICVAHSRCQGSRHRCSDNGLGRDVCLHLSPTTDFTPGLVEVPADTLHSAAHSPVLAKAELVPRPNESVRKDLHPCSSFGEIAETTKVRRVPPKPMGTQSSCLEVVQAALEGKGFSKEASRRTMAPQAASTLCLCQGKWKTFESWCESLDLDPFQASIPQIPDFLLFLFHEKKLSFKYIEGYRTAIS